jgi:GABA(A) receptor-associated protein
MIENIADFIQYKLLIPSKPSISCNFFNSFKKNNSFDERLSESNRILLKYSDRVPIIVDNEVKNNQSCLKQKYLVPKNITISQFMFVLRKRFRIDANQGLYMIINGIIPASNSFINHVYENYKDPDNFLYIILKTESTFGNDI